MSLADKAKSLPRKPGVYLFKDAKGEVLYVGKAKDLRARVASYFVRGKDERAQIEFLLRRTKDIDSIVTDTEKEALFLENTLIKQHKPRYNVNLRDDKSYVSIRIGMEHPFPGICLTRRVKKDGALYFGPYNSAAAARAAVDSITRYFGVRSCSDTEFANRSCPCIRYDMSLCTGPCAEKISKGDYAARVEEAAMFLSGKSRELLRILSEKMRRASERQDYEDAARLRDVVDMLKGATEPQKVVRHGGGDRDAIGIARFGNGAAVCALTVKNGALVSKRIFYIPHSPSDESKIIEEFLLAHYRDGTEIPPLIAIPHRPESLPAIAEILSERRANRVKISVPSRGDLKNLVELAANNAREALAQRSERPDDVRVVEMLGKRLGAGHPADVIECVDISNLSGREAVGSLVAFVDGKPEKSRYRLYNIRTLATPDDYAMMHEVLSRRFKAIDPPPPDILLVDGGKGQLAVAMRVMDELGLKLPLAAIAKGEKKGHADQVYIPGRKNPLNLKRGSKELLFLMRIRDEAHRFGISAHRKRRSKSFIGARRSK
ncbi:MAG: excinuclease ABC subunit UvrC [Pseudomonadota bacterium]